MAIFTNKTESAEEKKKPVAKAAAAGDAKVFSANLLGPRISEKSSHLANTDKYVFNVLKSANKIDIKKAVEKVHNVKVLRVNVVNVQGKNRNFGRTKGRTSGFRKAIVTLKKGDKIEGATETI